MKSLILRIHKALTYFSGDQIWAMIFVPNTLTKEVLDLKKEVKSLKTEMNIKKEN